MGQGAYIFGCNGVRLTREESRFFQQAQPWGFILFARNIEAPDQLRDLCADLRDSVGRDAVIMIDQEGGRVQRMRGPHWRDWRPARDHCAQARDKAPRAMWLQSRLIAKELHDVGIDANCAPLGDVLTSDTHPVLANRCYGTEPKMVASIAREVAKGLMSGGVMAVMKHLPGHGRARVDSHLDLPRVDVSADILSKVDFDVFRALSDLPMAMTAHIVYSALDERPATQSPKILSMIRSDIGFQGLLMTDDISMEALGGSLLEKCQSSLLAGCDVILHCNGNLSEMAQVVEVSGVMTPEAQLRADRVINRRGVAEPLDTASAEEELNQILGGSPYV